jgi:streptomycin 6-kinase
MAGMQVPSRLREAAADGSRDDWMAGLPGVIDAAQHRWSLTISAPFEPGGQCAWVAPARASTGAGVALKIGWPHPESEHEAAGLACWNGDGAVRLLDTATFGAVTALLLERCRPGATLADSAEPAERDPVIAGLLRRLWRAPPPGHPFRPLQQMCDLWADGAEQRLHSLPGADPGLLRTGLELFRSLPADPPDEVVLFTDLHAENVLAAEREPWLAIDPKPYVGDPCYDVLQHMLNVPALLEDPGRLVDRMAGLASLDAGRVRQWLFARCVVAAADAPDLYPVAARLRP